MTNHSDVGILKERATCEKARTAKCPFTSNAQEHTLDFFSILEYLHIYENSWESTGISHTQPQGNSVCLQCTCLDCSHHIRSDMGFFTGNDMLQHPESLDF